MCIWGISFKYIYVFFSIMSILHEDYRCVAHIWLLLIFMFTQKKIICLAFHFKAFVQKMANPHRTICKQIFKAKILVSLNDTTTLETTITQLAESKCQTIR